MSTDNTTETARQDPAAAAATAPPAERSSRTWINRRVISGLVTGLLAGAVAATGATAFAGGAELAPAAPVTCQSPSSLPSADGGTVTFTLGHPWAE